MGQDPMRPTHSGLLIKGSQVISRPYGQRVCPNPAAWPWAGRRPSWLEASLSPLPCGSLLRMAGVGSSMWASEGASERVWATRESLLRSQQLHPGPFAMSCWSEAGSGVPPTQGGITQGVNTRRPGVGPFQNLPACTGKQAHDEWREFQDWVNPSLRPLASMSFPQTIIILRFNQAHQN